MSSLPTIYTIQAADAAAHSEPLLDILQKMKSENRISDYRIKNIDEDMNQVISSVKEDDLILILLTQQLESDKGNVQGRFKTLKETNPNSRIAEIIVDNVPYENEFITLPPDFTPIAGREDKDRAWDGIEQNLMDMFPYQEKPAIPWEKYGKVAGLVVLVAALIWLVPKMFAGGPDANFTYYIGDATQDTLTSCYAPCNVQFVNESQNFDNVEWGIQDTVFTDRHLRLEFIQSGDIEISLTAFRNSRENSTSKKLLVKAPPTAAFEATNNGCTAPCNIEFVNTSTDAESYSWNFGNGQTSTEAEPQVRYNSPNQYRVTLAATNSDGMTSTVQEIVTAIPDDSPFADFTFSGNIGALPRQVTFTNNSQNADSFVWQFPGGTPSASSSRNPTVTYRRADSYSVTLIARKNDGRTHEQVKVVSVTPYIIIPGLQLQINEMQLNSNANEVQTRGFIKDTQINNRVLGQ